MKHLYLLRGTPGAGKTTLINTYNLQPFTLSADDIRQQYSNTGYAIQYNEEGMPVVKEHINPNIDGKVWETLLEMLESRMSRGETTIIDATHSNNGALKNYNKLVDKYRYRIFTIQLDVPLQKALDINSMRVDKKRMSSKEIERKDREILETMDKVAKKYNLSRFSNIKEAGEFILTNSTWNAKKIDPKKYENIYVIGDIHASYGSFKQFLDKYYKPTNYYVFIGDYLDRGLHPYDTVNAIHELHDKENVVLLRGNHETNYENWLNIPDKYTEEQLSARGMTDEKVEVRRKEIKHYKNLTRSSMKYIKELQAQVTTEDFKDFTNKLKDILQRIQDVFMFTANGTTYVCTHGGIVENVLNYNNTGSMVNFSTDVMVKGVGSYDDDIDTVFTQQMLELPEDKRLVQVHGHRNTFKHGVMNSKYSYNLEQGVTEGGYLGIIEVNASTGEVKDISIRNFEYRKTLQNTPIGEYPLKQFFEDAKQDEYIRVKKLKTVEDVYSINFNEKAFYDKVWTGMTVRARGLFINPITEKVIARSYDKFFNLNERNETKVQNLENKLVFPVTVSSKVNGFLGILTVYKGKFLFLSKSTDGSAFSDLFTETFMKHTKELGVNLEDLASYIATNNVSLVFEVVNQEKDPHIINYKQDGVILLDVFKNQLEEETLDKHVVPELENFLMPEERIFTGWEELKEYIYNYNKGVNMRTNPVLDYVGIELDQYNEGFVITDATNFRLKIKGAFYNTWKGVRPIIHQLLSGREVRVRTNIDREFVAFAKEYRKRDLTGSVLTERAEFVKYMTERIKEEETIK